MTIVTIVVILCFSKTICDVPQPTKFLMVQMKLNASEFAGGAGHLSSQHQCCMNGGIGFHLSLSIMRIANNTSTVALALR